jgi:hypothetical protein
VIAEQAVPGGHTGLSNACRGQTPGTATTA